MDYKDINIPVLDYFDLKRVQHQLTTLGEYINQVFDIGRKKPRQVETTETPDCSGKLYWFPAQIRPPCLIMPTLSFQ